MGPRFFGSPSRRRFGWFHHSESAARTCVVVCHPFGFELVRMHRPIRHLAEGFARAGFPTLRFDYDGTGDSVGDDGEPGRVRAWLDSIHDAIEHAKHESGADGVALVGIRLGAVLASAVAAERTDVRGVVAIAPVEPKTYLRELALFQSSMNLPPSELAEGDREAAGFLITRETAEALKKLPSSHAGLVFDREEPEFVAMNDDPHKAVPPAAMGRRIAEWLGEQLVTGGASSRGEAGASTHETSYREELVTLDDARQFGILSRSTGPVRKARRAILLLNAGAQHHIGPNRLWVTFARRWASRGHAVLRLDLSGLGESPPRAGRAENEVYSDTGAKDVAAAVAWLRQKAEHVTVVGLCGSAFQAFKAAVHGSDADDVILLNIRCFFWKDGMSLDAVSTRTAAVAEAQRYRSVMFEPAKWKKLFAGKVKVRAASRIVRQRLADMAVSRGRRIARKLRIPMADDLAAELRSILKHGGRVRFVFTDHEPGEAMLPELAGSIAKKFRVDRIEGADHTFTAMGTHELLAKRLDEWLGLARDEGHQVLQT